MEKYIIDAKSDENHFIIRYENGEELTKFSKKGNDLEAVKMFVGIMNIKAII